MRVAASKRNRTIVAVVAAVAMAITLAAIVFGGRGSRASAVPSASSTTAVRPAPSVPPVASTTVAPTIATGAAPVQEETTLHIETTPPNATILVGGATKGTAPMDITLPRSREPVAVEIRLAGYQTVRESVVPDVDQRLLLNLALLPRPQPTAPPAPPPSGTAPYYRFE